jgi:NADP-dependent 3-hydroxy acid dehydrogenase YdfG
LPVDGAVVVLTGASSGIGAVTARQLVAAGALVVGGARRVDRLRALADELGEERFVPCEVDVTDAAAVARTMDLARERFGRLDVVIANAAIAGGGTIAHGDPAEWEEILRTNVYGAGLTLHHGARVMLEQGSGHLVLMSSVIGSRVPPHRNHMYAASKWAVRALGEGLRLELNGTIRVTVVEPGFVRTDMSASDVALEAEDVGRALLFAIDQPEHMAINQIQMRPLGQEL